MRTEKQIDQISQTTDANALRTACEQEGCPICRVVLDQLARAMAGWSYEGFTDIEQRHQLIRYQGFCSLHTWQLAERNNAFQLAVVYKEVLTDILAAFPAQTGSTDAVKRLPWWKRLLRRQQASTEPGQTSRHCPFCHLRTKTEERIAETYVILLALAEFRTLVQRSTGLCRFHYQQALDFTEKHAPSHKQTLITCQRTCLQNTLREIEELVRKHDYRFTHEPRGDEMTSWRRAAELFAGKRGMY